MIDLPPAAPLALEGEHRAVETALRESEERFRAVWEATSEAMALSDARGTVLAVNPAYCALYGRPAEELVGRGFEVIFPEPMRVAALEQYRAVFAEADPPRGFEARVQRPDGSERIVESRADFLLRDGQRIAMISAIRDITERKRLERAQHDFIAMASHDLASPLTVLRAWAQLLQRRGAYDAASVDAILEQTTRMERLITDLRDLVQVEGGGLSLQRSPVDLVALVHEAVERMRSLATSHVAHLEAPEIPVVVIGDRDRLGQVLDNLLGNAVKYSPRGGEILIRVQAANGVVRVSVSDQGPGIPSDVLPQLFERFFRGQHAAGDAGLGLGLYISRMLVEAHGGQIRAQSEPGVGSVFTVTLPLGRTSDPR
jgi:PAS domain S-box-containing protein